jgi:hypothetical protein
MMILAIGAMPVIPGALSTARFSTKQMHSAMKSKGKPDMDH